MTLHDTIKQWEQSGTAGPWRIEDRYYPDFIEVQGASFRVSVVLFATDLTPDDAAIRRKDAALIAAAPQMVEALKAAEEMADLLQEYRDKTPLGHQPHMIAEAADEALAAFRQHMNAEK